MGSLLKAASCLLGRGVAPAVLVALAMRRPGEVGEFIGEGTLAQLDALLRQLEAIALAGEVALLLEAHHERPESLGGDRQEPGELGCGGALREPLRAHPVHRLENLLPNLEGLQLAHRAPPLAGASVPSGLLARPAVAPTGRPLAP